MLSFLTAILSTTFLLIIAAIFAGIYGSIFLFLVALFILGWLKRKPWLKWLAGISAISMVLLTVTFMSIISFIIIDAVSPSGIYKATFGEPPSAQIHELKNSIYWFADTGSVYLQFKTTESEFLRLVPDKLIEQSMDEMQINAPSEYGTHPPQWWKFTYELDWIYFLRNSSDISTTKKGFTNETEYYAYNPKDGFAYYRYIGVD